MEGGAVLRSVKQKIERSGPRLGAQWRPGLSCSQRRHSDASCQHHSGACGGGFSGGQRADGGGGCPLGWFCQPPVTRGEGTRYTAAGVQRASGTRSGLPGRTENGGDPPADRGRNPANVRPMTLISGYPYMEGQVAFVPSQPAARPRCVCRHRTPTCSCELEAG